MRILVGSLVIAMFSSSANAQSQINTTSGWDGAVQIGMFGSASVDPNFATVFGQTFLTSQAGTLDNFSFWLNAHPVFSPNVAFKAYVMAWDGAKATGPVLFESGVFGGPTQFMQRYSFATGGLALDADEEYVAFLSTIGFEDLMTPGAGVLGGYNLNQSAYPAGHFIGLNHINGWGDITSRNWLHDEGCPQCSAAFIANFDGYDDSPRNDIAPEPASIALLSTGLIGLGFVVRRRLRD